MYVSLTDHYKGRLPVDVGGLILNGRGPKETTDKLGKMIVTQNFPLVAECDIDGKFSVEIPPVPEPVEPAPLVMVDEKPAPKPEGYIEEVTTTPVDQPVIEPVEETKVKRSKK
jgi:hypothetical protein